MKVKSKGLVFYTIFDNMEVTQYTYHRGSNFCWEWTMSRPFEPV